MTPPDHRPDPAYARRLDRLRAAMRERDVAATVIPTADPHQSEYVAERFAARAYLSGFTGSAGTLVVTQRAFDARGGALFTDSRYYVQAPTELARTSGLPMVEAEQGGDRYGDWLAERLPAGATVGVDGRLFTVAQVRSLRRVLAAADLGLATDVDLADAFWPDRPALPATPLFSHPTSLAGRSGADKLAELRGELSRARLTHALLTNLDEIAWLLNVRASDIHLNPLAIAYAIVGLESGTLFTAPDRIDDATARRLGGLGVDVRPYAALDAGLDELPDDARVGIDEAQVNQYLAERVGEVRGVSFASPLRLAQAIKNDTEIANARVAHERDGVALVRAFRWLEARLAAGDEVRECDFAEALTRERARGERYYGPSFEPIVAYGPNAALPHYHGEPGADARIEPRGILLVDSGGQYRDGTTDLTRTVALGPGVTDAQRRRYTQVLRGHIALATAVFPERTTGAQLDTFARQYLWRDGADYGHGTGHGVGSFLSVHEAPQGFAPGAKSERARTPHLAGMLSSNEPGYYVEGEYGIRIENLVLATPAFPERSPADGERRFLRFETIGYFPVDTTLIDLDLLPAADRAWLDAYHAEVVRRLSPRLDAEERAWLEEKCARIAPR